MINKLKSKKNEQEQLDGSMDVLSKISSKLSSLAGISPRLLLNEAVSFVKRNSIAISKNKSGKSTIHFCRSCLRAHIEKVSAQLNMDKNIAEPISQALRCQAGHGGYYLDAEKLVKL